MSVGGAIKPRNENFGKTLDEKAEYAARRLAAVGISYLLFWCAVKEYSYYPFIFHLVFDHFLTLFEGLLLFLELLRFNLSLFF